LSTPDKTVPQGVESGATQLNEGIDGRLFTKTERDERHNKDERHKKAERHKKLKGIKS
jgi:hypothetical protein